MIKLLTIIGARPQIIKAAALSRAVNKKFSSLVCEKILHTGQHYDDTMSAVFFRQLGIPKPDYNLGIGSASQGVQTARMIMGIERVLLEESFDGVVLYGDTNSTLAGAIAASKLHVPVFHIEAGLRSFNMAMPEEINRVVCDHISSILFAPTQTAVENLRREGFNCGSKSSESEFPYGKALVRNVGDVMYDNALYYGAEAEKQSFILKDLDLEKGNFVLATVHRDFNTDNPKRLESIFRAFEHIAENEKIKIVIPLHPRTQNALKGCSWKTNEYIKIISPTPFFDMIMLEKNAKVVMTDSGGVQKEAFFYGKPCIILRPETEWVEIIDYGAGVVADADLDRIVESYQRLSGADVAFLKLFGDGRAADKILNEILHYFS